MGASNSTGRGPEERGCFARISRREFLPCHLSFPDSSTGFQTLEICHFPLSDGNSISGRHHLPLRPAMSDHKSKNCAIPRCTQLGSTNSRPPPPIVSNQISLFAPNSDLPNEIQLRSKMSWQRLKYGSTKKICALSKQLHSLQRPHAPHVTVSHNSTFGFTVFAQALVFGSFHPYLHTPTNFTRRYEVSTS